jgi:crotonobetainyl-CoA:carnitine CoA-transferase CaiB-like acyl-CoA transferase
MTGGLLSGLTVLEYAGGVATRYCGRLFAALGATVLQAGPPDETGTGYGGAASRAYARWLDSGKQPVPQTGGKVDLVLAGQTPAAVEKADAALRAAGLDAIRIGLTWFAPAGPYRHWTGTDALIQAMSGVAYATGPKDGPPLLPRGHAPQVVAGATAFIAALAALIGRDAGWRGKRIDINVLEANLCFSESTAASLALSGDKVMRRGVNRFTPTYPGGIYRALDAWIGVTALTAPQWIALCDMIGHPELARDPASLISLQRLERADELDRVLVPAFRQKPAAYWLAEGQARRIPMAPVPSLAELPRTAHWQERGSFAPVPGDECAVGPTLPFHIERGETGAAPSRPAAAPRLPLAGIRVLDLSMGWAGPLATRHFADLGADVLKVESCTHFDWWRGFDGDMNGDPPPYETRPSFLMVNRNKRGITLDLKSDAGKALVRRLAATSDIMVENYAPGVLDKLGIGPRALAAAVPGLICISMGAFGARGPWRSYRAYGSTVEQASGLPSVNGEADQPPTMQHVAYGDPIGGLYGAVACLVALYAQRQGRASTVIDLAQVECLFQLCADAIIAQSAQQEPLARTGSRHPLSALRTVVATATPAEWVAISVETVTQWNALAKATGCEDLTAPAQADMAWLKHHEDALASRLRPWAATRKAGEIVSVLQTAGVPASPVYPAQDLLSDPQLVSAGFWRRADRPFIGNHIVPLAPYRLDGSTPPLAAAAPTLGEHNAAVLGTGLGLSAGELRALEANGIIGTRATTAGVSG